MTKALAALVAGWLIYRELGRRGRDPELAYSLTLWGVVAGFAGAKLFYLTELYLVRPSQDLQTNAQS